SRRRHTRSTRDWSSDVCSSDLDILLQPLDLLADGRLGAVDALAGAGEAAGIDHRNEAAQQVEIEHANAPFINQLHTSLPFNFQRSEERRVGNECRSNERRTR